MQHNIFDTTSIHGLRATLKQSSLDGKFDVVGAAKDGLLVRFLAD